MRAPGFYAFTLLILKVLTTQCYQITFLDYCIDGSEPEPFPGTDKDSSGSIVMSKSPENGSWYLPGLNCSVNFSTKANYLLLLTFSNVSLRNSSMDNLIVNYDSGKSSMILSGQQVCSTENCEGLKFDSGEFNNLTLKFLSAVNVTVPQNVTGFQAQYTVYNLVGKNGACQDNTQFLCENGHCIWRGLYCDGHNNCGDRSDETNCYPNVRDTVWGVVIIVLAILSVVILVPIFICLATYGTKNIVKSVTLSSQATPLIPATDCGEASGLLTSSEAVNNCWPGTSYERSNSFSYGSSLRTEATDSSDKKYRSMSTACLPKGGKFL